MRANPIMLHRDSKQQKKQSKAVSQIDDFNQATQAAYTKLKTLLESSGNDNDIINLWSKNPELPDLINKLKKEDAFELLSRVYENTQLAFFGMFISKLKNHELIKDMITFINPKKRNPDKKAPDIHLQQKKAKLRLLHQLNESLSASAAINPLGQKRKLETGVSQKKGRPVKRSRLETGESQKRGRPVKSSRLDHDAKQNITAFTFVYEFVLPQRPPTSIPPTSMPPTSMPPTSMPPTSILGGFFDGDTDDRASSTALLMQTDVGSKSYLNQLRSAEYGAPIVLPFSLFVNLNSIPVDDFIEDFRNIILNKNPSSIIITGWNILPDDFMLNTESNNSVSNFLQFIYGLPVHSIHLKGTTSASNQSNIENMIKQKFPQPSTSFNWINEEDRNDYVEMHNEEIKFQNIINRENEKDDTAMHAKVGEFQDMIYPQHEPKVSHVLTKHKRENVESSASVLSSQFTGPNVEKVSNVKKAQPSRSNISRSKKKGASISSSPFSFLNLQESAPVLIQPLGFNFATEGKVLQFDDHHDMDTGLTPAFESGISFYSPQLSEPLKQGLLLFTTSPNPLASEESPDLDLMEKMNTFDI